jgi:hypothetical protein
VADILDALPAVIGYKSPMFRIALLALLIGCGPSDRERDCAEVRNRLGGPFAIPESEPSGVGIFDPGPLEELARFEFRDPIVRKTVLDVHENRWELFAPQPPKKSKAALERLNNLCELWRGPDIQVSADQPPRRYRKQP